MAYESNFRVQWLHFGVRPSEKGSEMKLKGVQMKLKGAEIELTRGVQKEEPKFPKKCFPLQPEAIFRNLSWQ